jgi:hypothetical protein
LNEEGDILAWRYEDNIYKQKKFINGTVSRRATTYDILFFNRDTIKLNEPITSTVELFSHHINDYPINTRVMLLYSFTHWGDRGLGDSARIPLLYFKEIDNTNWMTTAIDPENYPNGYMNVESFTIPSNKVVGKSAVSP